MTPGGDIVRRNMQLRGSVVVKVIAGVEAGEVGGGGGGAGRGGEARRGEARQSENREERRRKTGGR